ncbi:MAG TPA: glycosyltransferase family 4 protein [Thermoanaerobaculia bacterium]|jgi:glycosyltransferase involved in cell wall biosynthesis|nr:glycosyltransferase family 4 protein [Thermoanaerobaculia bacterium]
MMDVAEGLRAAFELDVCALDNIPSTVERTLCDELAARFGAVTFIRRRWELRPRFRAADAVLWYGVVNAVPDVLSRMDRRPASVRVVHTDREVDGPGCNRRWGQVIDRTVCVSPAVARRIPGAVFIPNTCSDETLQGPRLDLFPPGRRTLGFLGRLVPLKNVPWLIENVEALGCNLLVQALDTSLMRVAELQGRVAELHLEDRIRFLPPSRDVGTLLRSVDALAVVSLHEGFPRVVVEAGIVGTPVIATPVGALPELFPGEILFVDSESGVPCLDSMRTAIAQVSAAWGRRLRARVIRLCDRAKVIACYMQVLRDVLAQRAAA